MFILFNKDTFHEKIRVDRIRSVYRTEYRNSFFLRGFVAGGGGGGWGKGALITKLGRLFEAGPKFFHTVCLRLNSCSSTKEKDAKILDLRLSQTEKEHGEHSIKEFCFSISIFYCSCFLYHYFLY